MFMTYFNATVIAEWLTFVISVVLLNKNTGKWRLFIILLLSTLIIETLGWYQTYVEKWTSNAITYNIFTIFSASFFSWIISTAKEMLRFKKVVNCILILFLLFALFNFLFWQGPRIYNYITQTFGYVILIILLFVLVYQIIYQGELQGTIFNNEYFWLTVSMLFSVAANILFYTIGFLIEYSPSEAPLTLGNAFTVLNVMTYLFMIIAFVIRRKATRSN